jgi:hypothetical protein
MTFNKTTKSWESEFAKNGLWWDRYVITLVVPISMSSNLSSLKEKRSKVQITQLKKVSKHADGRFSFDFTGPTVELTEREWSEVSTNPISLSKFGVLPITNQPVPLASKYLEIEGVQ